MGLLRITTEECLRRVVKRRKGSIAISDSRGRALTWSDLKSEVDAVARGLLQSGFSKGDKFVIWSTNNIEWIVTYLAATQLGVIPVLASIHLKKAELVELLEQTDATGLCFCDAHRDSEFSEVITEIEQELVSVRAPWARHFKLFVHLQEKASLTSISLNDLKIQGALVEEETYQAAIAQVMPDDVSTILMTSGSTSRPKAVMLTHSNLINNAYFSVARLKLNHFDRICLAVPMFHCFGLSCGLFFALTTGCSFLLVETYCAEDVLKCVSRDRSTVLHGVPTMFSRLIEHENFSHYDLSSLKKGVLAGAYCNPGLIKKIYSHLGMVNIVVSYGQTESSPCCTQTDPDDPISVKCTSIGKPIQGVEMCIINKETSKQCGCNEVGELCTRGYHVMTGYYKGAKQTAETIDKEGWLHTGDAGYFDDAGNYHFLYRLKEIIIRGGENISPLEVERVLSEQPFIDQVKVYGVDDHDLGEVVAASVVLRKGVVLTQEELRDRLKPLMTHYKIPKYVDFIDAFPYTPSGKVDALLLKKKMLAKLVLNEKKSALQESYKRASYTAVVLTH